MMSRYIKKSFPSQIQFIYDYDKNILIIKNREKIICFLINSTYNKCAINSKSNEIFFDKKFFKYDVFKFLFNKKSNSIKIKKLNLVGVGYRALLINESNQKFLQLRLGYCHSVYLKIPSGIIVHCPKPSKIIILGKCQYSINNFAFKIRSYRKPDPYKGKGVLYSNETILLKEGKKLN